MHILFQSSWEGLLQLCCLHARCANASADDAILHLSAWGQKQWNTYFGSLWHATVDCFLENCLLVGLNNHANGSWLGWSI